MFQERCRVLENKKAAPGHFILKIASPRIAKAARPGQFVQILPGTVPLSLRGLSPQVYDPLLPRPFSFLTATKKDFSVLYHVIGRGTRILSEAKKGDALSVVGPLGNGFSVFRGQRTENRRQKGQVVLVGGGVGIPPLYHLAQDLLTKKILKSNQIFVLLGARNKSLLLCEKDFKKLGVVLHVATDDGSKGHRGLVTELLENVIASAAKQSDRLPIRLLRRPPLKRWRTPRNDVRIYTCGPTPMLKAVSAIARKYDLPCEVSVEVPMACGFGACLGCAVKVRSQKTENRGQKNLSSVICHLSSAHRFAIACTEGPVFEGKEIVWD